MRRVVFRRIAAMFLLCWVTANCSRPEENAGSGEKTGEDDRLPPEQQTLRLMTPEPLSLDSSIRPYDTRGTILPFEPLLRRNERSEPIPAAAERYESSPDGKTWTFYLRPNAKWSDGRPVTAEDVVYSYRRFLDPASANIYAFFYYDIANARDINHVKIKDITQLGVRSIDELTVEIKTEHPAPYLPYIVSFGDAFLAPQWVVEKYGPKWTEGGNLVTNSPYTIREWMHGRHMIFEPNPLYNGPYKPILQQVRYTFRNPASATMLPYENDEVDLDGVDLNDLDRVKADPKLSADLVGYRNMNTWYMYFRTQRPPFDDIRVREAFARAIDRETLCRVVLNGTAKPAYGMLPPGFKDYDGEGLKPGQAFDSQLAAKRMEEAGYPDGRGFPPQELWLRAPGATVQRVAAAIQGMLKEHIGVDITIRILDDTAYMNNLFAWKMNLGLLDFGADYPDPRNMLDMTWRSQPLGSGRQDWTHSEFDRLVDQARVTLDASARSQMYKQAEKILSESYGGVFLYHPMGQRLIKPWVKGYEKEADGTALINLDMPWNLYITKH
ncbi:MAG: peptide ABC transporter substrate-binding protein [candidate division Zixibacteria bacterium]|nr:peptide ABC transporter substrate-binding protein [candidate division Zixibacteria bacterium]